MAKERGQNSLPSESNSRETRKIELGDFAAHIAKRFEGANDSSQLKVLATVDTMQYFLSKQYKLAYSAQETKI